MLFIIQSIRFSYKDKHYYNKNVVFFQKIKFVWVSLSIPDLGWLFQK